MFRCAIATITTALALAFSGQANAQPVPPVHVKRHFTANALRGEVLFMSPPEVQLNGQNMRMAPGGRIRNDQNMMALSGSVVGKQFIVNYTVDDASGMVKDIWILDELETAKEPWPRTSDEARAWQFDFAAQRWIRP